MKPFLYLICGFIAGYLLKGATGLGFLYAPALIFPLILPYRAQWQRVVYFAFSITCYTLMIAGLAALKLDFLALAILFFMSAAAMYLAYSLLHGFDGYIAGIKSIFYFTAWYACIVFICSLVLKKDFMEEHIAYIIAPAWYWVVGREVNRQVRN